MKAGVVGLGKMGLLHMGILNSVEDVNLICVTETEKLIQNYIHSSLTHIHVYDDYETMLNSENLDLLYITTPIHTHIPIALSCIKNNCNFFMEKPLSSNIEDTKKLYDELKTTKLIHSVGYNRRFMSTFLKAKQLVEEEVIGDIQNISSTMYASNVFKKSTSWRSKKSQSGGGVLMDFGSHLVDLLIWLFGKIEHVSGTINSIYSSEVEDEAKMSFLFANDIPGELHTSWSIPGYRLPEININIQGKNGDLIVTEDFVKIIPKKSDNNLKNSTIFKQELISEVPIDIGGQDYTKEDLYFIDCIKNHKQSSINIFEASKTQCAIDAMYTSAKSNKMEMVNYFE